MSKILVTNYLFCCLFVCFAAYDLPQRPNEAHIFYGNLNKIVVSLLGSTKSSDCEQSDTELLLPSARRSSDTDRYSQEYF